MCLRLCRVNTFLGKLLLLCNPANGLLSTQITVGNELVHFPACSVSSWLSSFLSKHNLLQEYLSKSL